MSGGGAAQVGPLLRGPTGKRNCGSKAYQKVCLKGKKNPLLLLLEGSFLSVR